VSPLKDRILDAEVRGSKWLADANQAREKGDLERAAACDAKSQFWLDRFNLRFGARRSAASKKMIMEGHAFAFPLHQKESFGNCTSGSSSAVACRIMSSD